MKRHFLSAAFLLFTASLTFAGDEVPWSFQPIQRHEKPEARDTEWPRSEIDAFILARLEKEDLAPSPAASTPVLIRRLCLTLCGLPPSPEALAHWSEKMDREPEAIAELVDSLLRSPRFGEHWGRHWLDVARYADSTGGDANGIFPHAWRYRDYVIDGFNKDKPFDRFIREQIAGDLLPVRNDREWAENLVATGFLAVGQKLVGEVNERKFFADLVDEQIDATTRAFLGLTAACARCHDHKTDPIPQSDYYGLAAIFRNTTTHYGLIKAQSRQFSMLLDVTGMGLPPGRDALTSEELAALRAGQQTAEQKMTDVMREIRQGDGVTRAMLRRSRTQRDEAGNALQSYDSEGRPLSFAMGVQPRGEWLDTQVLERGELDRPVFVVPPGVLSVVAKKSGLSANIKRNDPNARVVLADWIASLRNPLTARVAANRVWHWLFGSGLVRSVDDFGFTGETPSHPELLDHLAVRLVENRWSIKRLIREIVLSRTWQQASAFREEPFAHDPDNRLCWRFTPQRLDAESIRDAMLAVGGRITLDRPAIPLLAAVGEGTVGQAVFEPEIRKIEAPVRSVYLPRVRSALPEMLELFDAPDASNVCGARETTTVPLQALFQLNAPFTLDQAAAFASRIASQPDDQRIGFAFHVALGREPTERERELSETYLARLQEPLLEDPLLPPSKLLVPFAQSLLCAAEFSILE